MCGTGRTSVEQEATKILIFYSNLRQNKLCSQLIHGESLFYENTCKFTGNKTTAIACTFGYLIILVWSVGLEITEFCENLTFLVVAHVGAISHL